MVIAIDGLGVNGKTTLAKMIADKYKLNNFNTGVIYRCIALYLLENNLDISEIERVTCVIEKEVKIDFIDERVILNGVDVTEKIQTEEISFYSTKWATILKIKEIVRKIQRNFIKNNDVVIEGRDIATRVAYDADIKFYLYSDFEVRVERLWKKKKIEDIETIRNNLSVRDDLDINGGNFVKPTDAIEIDVSNYSINEAFDIMVKYIEKTI